MKTAAVVVLITAGLLFMALVLTTYRDLRRQMREHREQRRRIDSKLARYERAETTQQLEQRAAVLHAELTRVTDNLAATYRMRKPCQNSEQT